MTVDATSSPEEAPAPEALRSLSRLLHEQSEAVERMAAAAEEAERLAALRESSRRHIDVTRDPAEMRAVHSAAVVAARRRIRVFERSPHLSQTKEIAAEQPASLSLGVSHTVIYDPSVLKNETLLYALRGAIALGEEARVTTRLPFRMLISDDRIALIMTQNAEHGLQMSIMRDPALVDISTQLFDHVWEQSIPMPNTGSAPIADEPTQETTELLTLLAAGLTDEAVARQLGVSTRTVARRIQRLCETFGATGRFQLGLQAARSQWLDAPHSPRSR